MSAREYIKQQADTLPAQVIEKIMEFVSYQHYLMGYDNDTDYLMSVPGMLEKIESASDEYPAGGVGANELWADV